MSLITCHLIKSSLVPRLPSPDPSHPSDILVFAKSPEATCQPAFYLVLYCACRSRSTIIIIYSVTVPRISPRRLAVEIAFSRIPAVLGTYPRLPLLPTSTATPHTFRPNSAYPSAPSSSSFVSPVLPLQLSSAAQFLRGLLVRSCTLRPQQLSQAIENDVAILQDSNNRQPIRPVNRPGARRTASWSTDHIPRPSVDNPPLAGELQVGKIALKPAETDRAAPLLLIPHVAFFPQQLTPHCASAFRMLQHRARASS